MKFICRSLMGLKVKCAKNHVVMLLLFHGFLCILADERYLHLRMEGVLL